MEYGVPYVMMMTGALRMQELCVDNKIFHQKVIWKMLCTKVRGVNVL